MTKANSHIIAGDQRLSQSILWQIQRHYFQRDGLKAWCEDIVPHTISSNPIMARAYSQTALAYWRDCVVAAQNSTLPLDNNQPLYIIELGAGSGRLAYHFLHHFLPQLTQSPLADLSIKYVMTDFVPEIVDFWRNHARFQPWVAAGVLDIRSVRC